MDLPISACKDTAESFACLTSAVEAFAATESGDAALPRGLAVFLPFVNLDAPRWPDVQKALLSHFGQMRKSRRRAVEPGEAGVKLVMTVLRRTVITDDSGCVAAVEQWLSWLELAVRERLADIANANAAPAAGQAATPAGAFPPLNDVSSPHANSVLQSRHGTMTTSTPVPATRSASSTPFVEDVHPAADGKTTGGTESLLSTGAIDAAETAGGVTGRAESRQASPSLDARTGTEDAAPTPAMPTATPLRRSSRAKASPRSVIPAASSLPGESDERANSSSEVRTRFAALPVSTQASGSSGNVGTTVRARNFDQSVATPLKPPKRAKLLLPAPTSPRIFRKAPSPITTPALIRDVFPHIDLPNLDKPFNLPDITADKRTFRRTSKPGEKGVGGNHQKTFNDGKKGTTYYSTRRFVALKPELNICDPGPTALGEPLVIITNDAYCAEFYAAVESGREQGSGPEPVPIHVFVQKAPFQWVYRGLYELAYDGSGERALQLPSSAGATANVHESIRRAVEALIDDGPAQNKNQPMLRSWGWKLPTYSKDRTEASKVDLWTELEVTDIKPRISFLVLRCVGFSEEDCEVWRGEREEVGVYRDPNEKR